MGKEKKSTIFAEIMFILSGDSALMEIIIRPKFFFFNLVTHPLIFFYLSIFILSCDYLYAGGT